MSSELWPRLLGDHTIQDGERGDEGWQQLWGSVGPLVILQPLWDTPDMQIMQWNWTSACSENRAKQKYRKTISESRVLRAIFVVLGCDRCTVNMHRISACMLLCACSWPILQQNPSGKQLLDRFYMRFQVSRHSISCKNRFHEKYLWDRCDFRTAVDHIWKYWFVKQKAIQIVIVQNIVPKFENGGYCLLAVTVKRQHTSHYRAKQFTEMYNLKTEIYRHPPANINMHRSFSPWSDIVYALSLQP